MSRTCLALLPMVVLATPNASLSSSAVRYGSRDGSDRKLTCPSAYTTPAAQVARRPLSSGEGRLRASFATTCLARAAYSASRSFAQTSSVILMTSSATGRTAFGMFSSSNSATAGILPQHVLQAGVPGQVGDRSATIRGARPAMCHDLGQGAAEVLPVVRGQRRDETAELRADLGVEGSRGPPPGVGQRRLQCAPVARHG